jgi:hypothetical protein
LGARTASQSSRHCSYPNSLIAIKIVAAVSRPID